MLHRKKPTPVRLVSIEARIGGEVIMHFVMIKERVEMKS
jgi:hypothetical protein